MKVRCQRCRLYVAKNEDLRRSGLGWVCRTCTEAPPRPKPKKPARPRDDPTPDTRQRVLNRDAHRCRRCARAATNAHHICYRSEGVDHQPHNLITLCPECHGIIHSDKKRWKPICLAYIWLRTVEDRHLTLVEVERLVGPR